MKSVRDADVKNKRVFLRVDFNVPMKEGKITDNNRIKAALLTINHLLEHKAKIIIATHLGRPDGKKVVSLSTFPLAEELAKLLKRKVFATDLVVEQQVVDKTKQLLPGEIMMVGNLRWYPGEEINDEDFAKHLAALADLCVNEAFSESHREVASLVRITQFLPTFGGLMLESEVTTFNLLLANPVRPFIVIIGGAKIKDKAATIEHLAQKADKILLGGAVANTFLSASGLDVGQSTSGADMAPYCQTMIRKLKNKLILPVDGVRDSSGRDGIFRVLDIGPGTIEKFKGEISKANTIFWNGNMGLSEDKRYANGSEAIARSVAENNRTKFLAGGDTVGFVSSLGLLDKFSYVSTGGGATLKFLAGEKLPGLAVLE